MTAAAYLGSLFGPTASPACWPSGYRVRVFHRFTCGWCGLLSFLALHAVFKGEAVFGLESPNECSATSQHRAWPSLVNPFPQLTPREREILHFIAQGLDNAVVAAAFYSRKRAFATGSATF